MAAFSAATAALKIIGLAARPKVYSDELRRGVNRKSTSRHQDFEDK